MAGAAQDYYSSPQSDKLNEVKGEINAVRDVMVQNIGTPQGPWQRRRKSRRTLNM